MIWPQQGRITLSWLALLSTGMLILQLDECVSAVAHRAGSSETLHRVGSKRNVLWVIVDNMRPALGAYGNPEVHTPHMDGFSWRNGSTLFTRAFCQLSWCAPSRNSFLTGRRPDVTRAWNFLDSFRDSPGRKEWVTLPGYFKTHGYTTLSVGKVFHPNLPPNFDFPASWTEKPWFAEKPNCFNETMSCEFQKNSSREGTGHTQGTGNATFFDVDAATTDQAIRLLRQWKQINSHTPFFLAVGLQSPRLPWSFPSSAAMFYPNASNISIAKHPLSPNASEHEQLEWFRPTEVNYYSDVRNLSHSSPMSLSHQHSVRRAYYAAITHVDSQFGRIMGELQQLGQEVEDNTVVILCADHGQYLGEHGLWSMMGNLEASLRVPLVTYVPRANVVPRFESPVELVDLFPTMAALARLPPPPTRQWQLGGLDLSPSILRGEAVKKYALGQITRCFNCTLAYLNASSQCQGDSRSDQGYTVPCCETPRTEFDFMGMSIRTSAWRYTTWCRWNGTRLAVDWNECTLPELFDHRNDTYAYNVDDFENQNLAGLFRYRDLQAELHRTLQAAFRAEDNIL